MYCGNLKKVFKEGMKVKDLIDILEPYKDLEVKVNSTDQIYIHFDQSTDFVDISNNAMSNKYGESETKRCKMCPKFDPGNGCECDGSDCVTFDLYKKYRDECLTCKVCSEVEENTKPEQEMNDKDLYKYISDQLNELGESFKKLSEKNK